MEWKTPSKQPSTPSGTYNPDDRSRVDFRSFTVSERDLAGKTIAELNLPGRFGAVVTRIHRGDFELLASDFEHLDIGDRVMVAFPRPEYENLENFFGNSERTVTQVDAVGLGLGMVLGLLLGMIEVSLPGGGTFSLGSAAGPLIVGMVLGYLQRTGPLVWQLPIAANETIRHPAGLPCRTPRSALALRSRDRFVHRV